MGWIKSLFMRESIGDIIKNRKMPFRSEAYFVVRGLSFVMVFSYRVNDVTYYQSHVIFDDATEYFSEYYTDMFKCLNNGIEKLKAHKYPWGGTMDISQGKIEYRKEFEPINYN